MYLHSRGTPFPILSQAVWDLYFQTDTGKWLASVTAHCSSSKKLDGRDKIIIFFLTDLEKLRNSYAL